MSIDPTAIVHPSAVVEPGATLGPNCSVGPFALIGAEVTLAAGVTVKSHAVVTGVADALVVAEKICQSLHVKATIDGHDITIAASVGVALYPDHAHDMKTLVHRADTAMYQAKSAGGNQVRVATLPGLPGAD